MPEKFKYDVFLSHSPKDKDVVRELAERLAVNGIHVWLTEWQPSADHVDSSKLELALRESKTLLLVMTQNSFGSDWRIVERHIAIFRSIEGSEHRLIPILLENCHIPEELAKLLYVDMRLGDRRQFDSLLSTISLLSDNKSNGKDEHPAPHRLKTISNKITKFNPVAITENGALIAYRLQHNNIRILSRKTGRPSVSLPMPWGVPVKALAFTADGKRLIAGLTNGDISIWDTVEGKKIRVLHAHNFPVHSIAIRDDGGVLISGSRDLKVWHLSDGELLSAYQGHTGPIRGIAITKKGDLAISGSDDTTIRVWDLVKKTCVGVLAGHTRPVLGVAVAEDGKYFASCSSDMTIRIWNLLEGTCVSILEGHTQPILSIVTTRDGRFVISASKDKTIRIWNIEKGDCIAILRGHEDQVFEIRIAADDRTMISSSADGTVRIWDIAVFTSEDYALTKGSLEIEQISTQKYTNAKVLLVGDSGVGKTGLAYRLTQNTYVSTDSTDGVWATQLKLPHSLNTNDTEREIWLWDFAGQADYRLIHQLFMDETSLAVLVFNPQADNPFEGLGQWDKDLRRAARRPFNKLLVAGRCDRGSLMVSAKTIDSFKDEREFSQYLETSALTGNGCDELREAIINHINWNRIPYRSSPYVFRLIKDEILELRDEGHVLFTLSELKQNLEIRLSGKHFTFEEFRAVVALLTGSGIVWELEFGDFVLLKPERINTYAAAVVRSVRAHSDEIGCIAEEKVLRGELNYQDIVRLPWKEEEIILRAMHQIFVQRGLCLREHSEAGVLLIFPSYFRRERPNLIDHPAALVTYQFSGMLDEIYATLVVKLHHTTTFEKDQLWRYAADFRTQSGKRVGLKMTKKQEGSAEITVYFDPDIPDDTKVIFIRYVQDHLKTKDESVVRVRHYVCPHCKIPFENEKAIEIRLEKNLKDIICPICEKKFDIWDLIEEKFASDEFQERVREMEEQASIKIDNESRELILIGDAYAISGKAGQIFRQTSNSDWGIDGEIEFKDSKGKATGKLIHLQLKSGDSHLRVRKRNTEEVFDIDPRHAAYWAAHNNPVMLVVRDSAGEIRWMNVSDYLRMHGKDVRQIVFEGEPFTPLTLQRMRDRLISK